ncbi:hypothetical protein C8J57DRAFT_1222117 [Mycena rebaudengoi]|nr:hypothetical protein C8J57DRAFT_1222117 [Mycena rebaudengoi]
MPNTWLSDSYNKNSYREALLCVSPAALSVDVGDGDGDGDGAGCLEGMRGREREEEGGWIGGRRDAKMGVWRTDGVQKDGKMDEEYGSKEALFEQVSALEDRAPPAGGLNITVLSEALATRFEEITSDRDKLSAEIRFQAEKQAKIDAKHRLEQKEMMKTLEEMQRTIAHLELGSAAPLHLPPHTPDHRLPAARNPSTAPVYRSRSPPALPSHAPDHRLLIDRSHSPLSQPPLKRTRLADMMGILTMGPLEASNLPPHELFTLLVSSALPSFDLTTVSHVILDPVYPYHLCVTLRSSFDVDNLIAMWDTGENASASYAPIRRRSPSWACEDPLHARRDHRESSSTVCRKPFYEYSYRGSGR